MSGFLQNILKSTRQDLEKRKGVHPLEEIKKAAARLSTKPQNPFMQAITAEGISVIAEVKRASPSKGDIHPDLDVAQIVGAYERGGARAISVLTEEKYFKGSLDDLMEARRTTRLPILRKDFIVDSYQVWEAAQAGADAFLLIVAALSPEELKGLMDEAEAARLEYLVEVHNLEELHIAIEAGAPLIGINNRDLTTFKVDLQTTLDMVESMPEGVPLVSESGISDRKDVVKLAAAGVDAILVGETLMRSPNPAGKLKELLSV